MLRAVLYRCIATMLLVLAPAMVPLEVCATAQNASPIQTHNKGVGFGRYACGPQVLGIVLDRLGRHESYENLIELSGTKKFITTLAGMQEALARKGLESATYRAVMEDMPQLTRDHLLICHTRRNHYVLVTRCEGKWLWMIDTYMGPEEMRVPREVFSYLWDGAVLAVRNAKTAQPLQIAKLSGEECKAIIGGLSNCENSNAGNGAGSGNSANQQNNTHEPVNVTNGNFFTERTDLVLPGRLLPLELKRINNSQTLSSIEGWTPEPGAGTWVIEDGELSGEGDRFLTDQTWGDGTILCDMQTVAPGENYDYEVAWLNFRFQDEKNRYYVLLHTNGILELTRFKGAKQTFLTDTTTRLNALAWNKFQVQTTSESGGLRIRISVNDVLYIDFIDADSLAPGKVVLEAYYSHDHYDNISISDASKSESYNFDVDDNDRIFGCGWTGMLDCSVREFSNGNLLVLREGGRNDLYVRQADGSFRAPQGVYDSITKSTSGYELARIKDNIFYRFDISGHLQSIRDRNNNIITLQYSNIQVQ